MKINSYQQLRRWDFVWPSTGDGPWAFNREGIDTALGCNRKAIGVYWIGYSPCEDHGSFQPKYCGKAVKQSLYVRLNQHVKKSSNQTIRKHLASNDGGLPPLWFRIVEMPTLRLADLLEGMEIAAFAEEYWNRRNEWTQHWAMEDDYPRK